MPKKLTSLNDKKQADNGPWFVEETTDNDVGYYVPNTDIMPVGHQIVGDFEDLEQRRTGKPLNRFKNIFITNALN
jgi:hypothetical protein